MSDEKKAAEGQARIKAERVKEEAAQALAEKEKAAQASDKEKLTILASIVMGRVGTVASGAAKTAIQSAHDILLRAAERM